MSRRKGKNAPESDQDPPLYFRTDVTPEEIFQAIGRLRKEARDEIDRLIRFLDKTDDYVELEDSIDDNPQMKRPTTTGRTTRTRIPPSRPSAALGTCTSAKSVGQAAPAGTLSKTTPSPASGIRMGWTSRSRSATGKAWGWCDGVRPVLTTN